MGSFGVAGGGLVDASWAANADVAAIGRRGEVMVGGVLDAVCSKSTVLHDVRIPIPGFTANVDHIVVSGSNVLLIDSKMWKPGFYWTVGGVSRRGMKKFAPADKKTMSMAHDRFAVFLAAAGAEVAKPLVVVCPSNSIGALNVSMLRIPASKSVPFARFESQLRGWNQPADTRIVSMIRPLLFDKAA